MTARRLAGTERDGAHPLSTISTADPVAEGAAWRARMGEVSKRDILPTSGVSGRCRATIEQEKRGE